MIRCFQNQKLVKTIFVSLLLVSNAAAQSTGRFSLERTVFGGGGMTAGLSGTFNLNTTVGQPIAGLQTGQRFSVQQGFWVVPTLLIFAPTKVGNDFTIAFETVPGRTYFVEFTDSLLNLNWQPLPTVFGNGATQSVTNSAPGVFTRYYRIREQ